MPVVWPLAVIVPVIGQSPTGVPIRYVIILRDVSVFFGLDGTYTVLPLIVVSGHFRGGCEAGIDGTPGCTGVTGAGPQLPDGHIAASGDCLMGVYGGTNSSRGPLGCVRAADALPGIWAGAAGNSTKHPFSALIATPSTCETVAASSVVNGKYPRDRHMR